MNFHGGTPRLYFKSLSRYLKDRIIGGIFGSVIFTWALKLFEKLLFRKASRILRIKFKNKKLKIRAFLAPLPNQVKYELELQTDPVVPLESARVFALYLPQFHPLTVNDSAWGEGFTEWINVSNARPLFEGHSQPILPGKLGFYDLRNKNAIREQVLLAKSSGIQGFVVFIYWFGDYAIMDQPLKNIMEVCEDEKFQFVFEWANEPWTRKWDGLDSEVILEQSRLMSPEIARNLVEHYKVFFNSPSYLSTDGSPVFFVYNPAYFMPGAREILATAFVQSLQKSPYLIGMQTFGTTHDEILHLGYDDSAEYFPHNFTDFQSPVQPKKYPWTISVSVQDYQKCVNKVISSSRRSGIPSCFPSWDNSPRRKFSGSNVFVNSNPADFGKWLENSIERADERRRSGRLNLVLVNAWNEWAEGTVLEPTWNSGYAYLNALKSVILEAK